ncbi:hypothetical protein E1B28_000979 [Marasmius oreades]|uniref:Uncharacterized protein n=1 Tax=Marasmius oreades TaxID=181124 RepID=A0A9P7V2J7_9AGAR|nr:uncharacterized protein E1B28_000979 [Marasmius oreades]KAG7099106.1 hypothetical protein E1B28_000979 [Marasmius oreades]
MLRSKQPPSLDHLRTSPVRGQLEPQDPKAAKGWRYLQTTDTVDEIKVLLPPHTASMYEQLLKLEKLELARKNVSWERILEIRHLKDRMVRKCQKLSSIIPPRKHSRNEPFTFQTIVAPADFRLKEMEKWFRQQQLRLSTVMSARPSRTHTHARSSCCARCAVSPRLGPTRTFVRRESPEHIRVHPPASPAGGKVKDLSKGKPRAETPVLHESPQSTTREPPLKAESIASISSIQLPPMSPPPLPIILRRGGIPASELPPPEDEEPASVGPSGATPPPLRHRRSCIKRSNTGDSVKTVSWADDRELTDRIAKFTSAAQETGVLDKEWEELRQVYVHHMDKLEGLEGQVQESLSRLEAEAARLHTVCEGIRGEKTALRDVVTQFGQKHSSYREKGLYTSFECVH